MEVEGSGEVVGVHLKILGLESPHDVVLETKRSQGRNVSISIFKTHIQG